MVDGAPAPRWVLVFPPLVHSNWGEYYPSTAVLAGMLRTAGVPVRQLDLNAELLDYLLRPQWLAALEAELARAGRTPTEKIPERAAAQLVRDGRQSVHSPAGRHRSQIGSISGEIALELARRFHVDEPIEHLASCEFASSPVARAYQDFFAWSHGLVDALADARDAVAISVPMGPQLGPALLLARFIRERRADLRIVLGGPTITLLSPAQSQHLLARAKCVDAIAKFEGERALAALAQQLCAGVWQPSAIRGVLAAEAPDVHWTGSDPVRLRALPLPEYDSALLARLEAPRLGVLQARGCYWGKCSYCDFIELFSERRRYDGRTGSSVAEEMATLAERHGVDRFWLITEALPPGQATLIARALNALDRRIDWRSFAMVDRRFTAEVMDALVASGCSSLTIGLETTVTRVLENVRKGSDRDEELAFLERARMAGLRLDINLIPNLPTTTRAEALSALEDVRSFADVFNSISVFPFEATASSEIGRNPRAYGLSIRSAGADPDALYPHGQAQFVSNRLVYEDGGMTQDELREVMVMYEGFAREVARRRSRDSLARGDPAPRGLRVRSESLAVLPEADATLVYDWERDRIWRLGPQSYEPLRWLAGEGSGQPLHALANTLSRQGLDTAASAHACTELYRFLQRAELLRGDVPAPVAIGARG